MNVTTEDLQTLLKFREGWCVSLYMATHRAGPDIQQDPIRLKNLLSEAEQQLAEEGVRSTEIKTLLKPASELLDDHAFWRHQEDGLAVFLAQDWHQIYRLPLSFPELVTVNSRICVKPLLPLFLYGGRFYLLALSQNKIRLFSGTREHLREIPIKRIPHSMAEAFQDESGEQSLQFHTRAPNAGDRRAAVFHGQGGGDDDAKERIMQFFQQVEKGVHDYLRDQQIPLFMTGVEYLFPLYREANTYPYLMDESLTGNPDGKSPHELHTQVWPIIQKHFDQQVEQAGNQFEECLGTGKASDDVKEVVLAAWQGRVDTLFVAQDVQQWGRIDISHNRLHLEVSKTPEAEETLNYAAVQTLLNSGTVYALTQDRMPGKTSIAAIFRY